MGVRSSLQNIRKNLKKSLNFSTFRPHVSRATLAIVAITLTLGILRLTLPAISAPLSGIDPSKQRLSVYDGVIIISPGFGADADGFVDTMELGNAGRDIVGTDDIFIRPGDGVGPIPYIPLAASKFYAFGPSPTGGQALYVNKKIQVGGAAGQSSDSTSLAVYNNSANPALLVQQSGTGLASYLIGKTVVNNTLCFGLDTSTDCISAWNNLNLDKVLAAGDTSGRNIHLSGDPTTLDVISSTTGDGIYIAPSTVLFRTESAAAARNVIAAIHYNDNVSVDDPGTAVNEFTFWDGAFLYVGKKLQVGPRSLGTYANEPNTLSAYSDFKGSAAAAIFAQSEGYDRDQVAGRFYGPVSIHEYRGGCNPVTGICPTSPSVPVVNPAFLFDSQDLLRVVGGALSNSTPLNVVNTNSDWKARAALIQGKLQVVPYGDIVPAVSSLASIEATNAEIPVKLHVKGPNSLPITQLTETAVWAIAGHITGVGASEEQRVKFTEGLRAHGGDITGCAACAFGGTYSFQTSYGVYGLGGTPSMNGGNQITIGVYGIGGPPIVGSGGTTASYGIYGKQNTGGGFGSSFAGYFEGDVWVTESLFVGGGGDPGRRQGVVTTAPAAAGTSCSIVCLASPNVCIGAWTDGGAATTCASTTGTRNCLCR